MKLMELLQILKRKTFHQQNVIGVVNVSIHKFVKIRKMILTYLHHPVQMLSFVINVENKLE